MAFDASRDILALDFDGVIADSIEECLVVGHNAYTRFQGEGQALESLQQLAPAIARAAREMRNFIRFGEDYVYIHMALSQAAAITNQLEFDDFLDKNQTVREEFRRLFYAERLRFLEEQPGQWLHLNPFYAGVRTFLRDFRPRERLYIITTKKTTYVERILDNAGIDLLPGHIFLADKDRSKTEIIAELLGRHKQKPKRFYFIDDQVDTLLKAQSTGVRLLLAKWGYTNDNQVKMARNAGITILEPDDFFIHFSGFSPKSHFSQE